MRVEPFGDEALRFALPDVDRHALDAALRRVDGVTDVVFGEHIGMVVGAPQETQVAEVLARTVASVAPTAAGETVLAVQYDGPDLTRVAEWSGLRIDTVVERHSAPTYTVRFLGFLPGFAYMGDVDPSIAAPRLPSPRPRIPAGSVAVAGARTGVYPFASPGGWNLLGHVGIELFDLARGARLHAGDRVRFTPTDRAPSRSDARRHPRPPPTARHLDVLDVVGPAWVQDGGRPGRRGDGVPPGGALVPELLWEANAAIGNEAFAPAFELFGSVTIAARGGDLWLGWAGEPVRLARDHVRRFDARGLGYLAVEGGLDTPVFLGGRGALPVLGFPDLRGPIGLGGLQAPAAPSPPLAPPDTPIRLSPGPEPAGLDALLAFEWIVGPNDRTGMRLLGPPLPSITDARLPSAPMVRGAIQLPPGGAPVVLGPDHPTTGGYPVVAVVRRADQGALAARPVGARVRFVL